MTFEYHEWFGGWWLFTSDFVNDREKRIYWKELELNLKNQNKKIKNDRRNL